MVDGLQGEKWKFIQKYPKVSVATIGKLQENTRALCKMAAKSFRNKRVIPQHFCKMLSSA